jgi:hypothetical protein
MLISNEQIEKEKLEKSIGHGDGNTTYGMHKPAVTRVQWALAAKVVRA